MIEILPYQDRWSGESMERVIPSGLCERLSWQSASVVDLGILSDSHRERPISDAES